MQQIILIIFDLLENFQQMHINHLYSEKCLQILVIIFDIHLSFVVLYVNTLPVLLCHKKKQVQGFLHTCNVSTNMV